MKSDSRNFKSVLLTVISLSFVVIEVNIEGCSSGKENFDLNFEKTMKRRKKDTALHKEESGKFALETKARIADNKKNRIRSGEESSIPPFNPSSHESFLDSSPHTATRISTRKSKFKQELKDIEDVLGMLKDYVNLEQKELLEKNVLEKFYIEKLEKLVEKAGKKMQIFSNLLQDVKKVEIDITPKTLEKDEYFKDAMEFVKLARSTVDEAATTKRELEELLAKANEIEREGIKEEIERKECADQFSAYESLLNRFITEVAEIKIKTSSGVSDDDIEKIDKVKEEI